MSSQLFLRRTFGVKLFKPFAISSSSHGFKFSSDSSSNRWQSQFFPEATKVMLPAGSLENRVAFITGGGTGLGKTMATTLSHLGANVVICSRNLEVLQKTASEINKETKKTVLAVNADVRDPSAIANAVDKCVQTFGLPTIIINNAAGNFICPTERLSPNGWKTIIDIVLNGTAFVTMDIGKRLIAEKKGGVFLSITTPYAQTGSGFVAASASAKAGVEILTKSLAAEWGCYGIRLNCIAPGAIETKGAFSRLLPSEDIKDKLFDRIPAGRLGHVMEIGNLAAYLVSDFSSWMNGTVINLDGGEATYISGAFNMLKMIKSSDWDQIQTVIRGVKGS